LSKTANNRPYLLNYTQSKTHNVCLAANETRIIVGKSQMSFTNIAKLEPEIECLTPKQSELNLTRITNKKCYDTVSIF